jgi:ribosomal protein L16 Arg81 hydroxylase
MNSNLIDLKKKFYYESELLISDRPFVFKNLISNPEVYLTWNDVEYCLNNPVFYNFDLIDIKTNDKIKIPEHKKAWVFNKQVQDKKFIFEKINQGHTLIINNYGFHSRQTQELLGLIESVFYTDSAMHVYCGFEGSGSFKIHEDIPANFIFQVEGKTSWKVYKNRASSIVASGYSPTDQELANFNPELEIDLEPGDLLYIPSRTYHAAFPTEKRLSISIPCWPKFNEPTEYSIDRNHYTINQI